MRLVKSASHSTGTELPTRARCSRRTTWPPSGSFPVCLCVRTTSTEWVHRPPDPPHVQSTTLVDTTSLEYGCVVIMSVKELEPLEYRSHLLKLCLSVVIITLCWLAILPQNDDKRNKIWQLHAKLPIMVEHQFYSSLSLPVVYIGWWSECAGCKNCHPVVCRLH